MPYLETPLELAESIADSLGIYGGHNDAETSQCRVCFVSDMTERIKAAVANEKKLEASDER